MCECPKDTILDNIVLLSRFAWEDFANLLSSPLTNPKVLYSNLAKNLCRFQSVLDEDLRQPFLSSSSLVPPGRSFYLPLTVCEWFLDVLSLSLWPKGDYYELCSRSTLASLSDFVILL